MIPVPLASFIVGNQIGFHLYPLAGLIALKPLSRHRFFSLNRSVRAGVGFEAGCMFCSLLLPGLVLHCDGVGAKCMLWSKNSIGLRTKGSVGRVVKTVRSPCVTNNP